MSNSIIVKSLGLIFNDNKKILVSEGYDSVKKDYYYRCLGGHVDFNEKTIDTVRREFIEELGVNLKNLRLFTILENMFECDGIPGHEIIYVYTADFADLKYYKENELKIMRESNGENLRVVWVSIQDCINGKYRFVPEELNKKLHTLLD